ncbi:DUF4810 domain-containing protein [Massilia psychrophila]|uniref:DUF4810 domain-containing protein n=1 Tax=Massilia psychrophila TaxID=1603353 RepID=UPI001E286CBE|nr:DUF4810 domain-containing protein [Massilia psychrophila]
MIIGSLVGCAHAPAPMYQWDAYQRNVYQFLKHEDANPGEQIRLMQAQIERAKIAGTRLPPGFRAHIAMLHLQLGQYEDAQQQFKAEKAAFPESSHYMEFLMK